MCIIQKHRIASFKKQSGLCYYCRQPMWNEDPALFSQQHGLTMKRGKLLQATAEHLRARTDGGGNTDDNIVAACLFCNLHRHQHRPQTAPSANNYLRRVRQQISKGKWHGINITSRRT